MYINEDNAYVIAKTDIDPIYTQEFTDALLWRSRWK